MVPPLPRATPTTTNHQMSITTTNLRALADQLAADAAAVREILKLAEASEITPEQAAKLLRERGLAIVNR